MHLESFVIHGERMREFLKGLKSDSTMEDF